MIHSICKQQDNMINTHVLDRVTILMPKKSNTNLESWLSSPPPIDITPFSQQRCNTLNKLSQLILHDPVLRLDSASVSLGFWLRRANIHKLKERFETRKNREHGVILVPVGHIFHIAPANVDTLFVYSWALSYLSGNSNIVRLSTQQNEIVGRLIACINDLAYKDDGLYQCNMFVRYGHEQQITETISNHINHRIIWGGDETVSSIRAMYLNPHASERVFASKFSFALISAQAYDVAESKIKQHLAYNFFNDMFWFDQMACSSPHIVFWVGTENDVEKAAPIFDRLLENEVQKRNYYPTASQAVHRINFAFNLAVQKKVTISFIHNGFVSAKLFSHQQLQKEICGGGFLTHVQLDSLEQLVDYVSETDQTITHFGVDNIRLRQLAYAVGSRGVDRIVPIGKALDFSPDWDGYDLLSDFVRRVVIQAN